MMSAVHVFRTTPQLTAPIDPSVPCAGPVPETIAKVNASPSESVAERVITFAVSSLVVGVRMLATGACWRTIT